MEKDLRKAIDEVCKAQLRQVEEYFRLLKENKCLKRIDKREQFIMKMMPLVFRTKLFKRLGVSDDSFKKIIPA